MNSDAIANLGAYRPDLVRHAYRMLGQRAEAEDAVQEAFLRRHSLPASTAIENEHAYLRATVTRICIDTLRSARARREIYVGPWLPEPLVAPDVTTPEDVVTLADDVSFALLLALERLSTLERAAFLLHDVMGVPFGEVAQTLERSEDAVKVLASRARKHVREARPRSTRTAPRPEIDRVCGLFATAIATGSLADLQRLLTDDVVLLSDGGGNALAAINPLNGRDHVGRFLIGVAAKAPPHYRIVPAVVNNEPGFIVVDAGHIVQTVTIEIENQAITAIYIVRNPEKLSAVTIPGPP